MFLGIPVVLQFLFSVWGGGNVSVSPHHLLGRKKEAIVRLPSYVYQDKLSTYSVEVAGGQEAGG